MPRRACDFPLFAPLLFLVSQLPFSDKHDQTFSNTKRPLPTTTMPPDLSDHFYDNEMDNNGATAPAGMGDQMGAIDLEMTVSRTTIHAPSTSRS